MINKVDMKRWQLHLDVIERQGVTVARYAREQGLSKHTLYAARAMQRTGAAKKATRKQTMTQPGQAVQTRTTCGFTAVKLIAGASIPLLRQVAMQHQPAAPTLRAWLPNGTEVELACSRSDTALVRVMLDTLQGHAIKATQRQATP